MSLSLFAIVPGFLFPSGALSFTYLSTVPSARVSARAPWCPPAGVPGAQFFGPKLFVFDVDFGTFGGSPDVVGLQATPPSDMFLPMVHRATEFVEELTDFLVLPMEPPS